ncbi:MAG: response regulator [Ignavibacteriae bacterium]|nr:response regulator [Ignavibacteriota bacterium]
MPKVNGIQVLEQMKADKVLMNIPVVVLTSSRESKDLDRCIELGVSAYMVKPVTFIDFVEATRNVGRYWALVHKPVNNPTLLEHA